MSTLLRRAPAAVGALALLAACGDTGTAPPDTGVVTVRVYLDRDPASPGVFTPADSAFAGVAVALAPVGTLAGQAGRAPLTATTDAQGVATFAGVPAGQYTAALTGFTAPAGAVLTGTATPLVAVPLRALDIAPAAGEFRFAWFPGTVSGLVFRDLNGNATYDPAVDLTSAGIPIRLTRDSAGTQVVASTAVASDASYRFETVTPGTYFVQLAAPVGFTFGAAGTTRRVVVQPTQASTVNATYVTVTTPIATARTLPAGTALIVSGVLTARPGQMSSGAGSEIWVQDATGGIAAFSVPTADSTRLALGALVEISGTLGANAQQLQLGGTVGVTVVGTGTLPAPVAQTGAQVNARTNEGRLVTLAGFRVTSVPAGTGASFTVVGTTPDGQTVQVRVGSNLAGITRANFAVGTTYAVTGILSQFSGTAQIKPRTPADIVVTP